MFCIITARTKKVKIDINNWQTRKLKDTEMAAIYGVSRATIWRWAKSGTIPAPQKIGANTARWDGATVAKSMETSA
jgi:predicted DNA-binding transcriptional regulator AlpA